mgnify:CR=1 FL=1
MKTIIYTNISRDGAEQGTNLALYRELAEIRGLDITASGGVSSIAELKMRAVKSKSRTAAVPRMHRLTPRSKYWRMRSSVRMPPRRQQYCGTEGTGGHWNQGGHPGQGPVHRAAGPRPSAGGYP